MAISATILIILGGPMGDQEAMDVMMVTVETEGMGRRTMGQRVTGGMAATVVAMAVLVVMVETVPTGPKAVQTSTAATEETVV